MKEEVLNVCFLFLKMKNEIKLKTFCFYIPISFKINGLKIHIHCTVKIKGLYEVHVHVFLITLTET